MIKLSIEQKAKAYDEAIERAKDQSNKYCLDKIVLEEIFPELKESEDEIVIAALKSGINGLLKKEYHLKGIGGISFDRINTWLEKQGEQKPADKVEPKFKIGDWVIDKQGIVHQIANVIENVTYHTYGYDLVGGGYFVDSTEGIRLWTIQDAKKGDILQANKCALIFDSLAKDIDGNTVISSWYHCNTKTFYGMGTCKPDLWVIEGVTPATKEQRDLLFQKMKEAGYEWDADKKELKKIEQKPADLPNGKDYGIDGLYAAIDILQKTLGKVEGYQTDDGILEHECAISAVKELSKHKPAWDEEDEKMIQDIINDIAIAQEQVYCKSRCEDEINWLKSLKDKVQPKSKQEWSEEDEYNIAFIVELLYGIEDSDKEYENKCRKMANWLKSLRPQNWTKEDKERYISCLQRLGTGNPEQPETINSKWFKEHVYPQSTWKPSDEQMKILNEVLNFAANHESPHWNDYIFETLNNLIRQLKKLREE